MDPYIILLDLGISLGKTLLGGIKSKAAGEIANVLDAGQAFVDALEAHKADVLSKQNFEAQRG